jgi:hypothetical protein
MTPHMRQKIENKNQRTQKQQAIDSQESQHIPMAILY